MYFSYVQMDFIWRINLRKWKSISWHFYLTYLFYRINENNVRFQSILIQYIEPRITTFTATFVQFICLMFIRCHQGYQIYWMSYWNKELNCFINLKHKIKVKNNKNLRGFTRGTCEQKLWYDNGKIRLSSAFE